VVVGLHQQADQHEEIDMTEFPKIGRPALNALRDAGYTQLEQLSGVDERELLALHGFGPKAITILQAALSEHGLAPIAVDKKT
jgi:predicted Fe-Mo cluster-binding NifX family protein